MNRQFRISVNGVLQYTLTVPQDRDPADVARSAREVMKLENVTTRIVPGIIDFRTTGGLR
jgi:hypothetical protein